MSTFDYTQTFVRAKELQSQLAQDPTGERMRELISYFAEAEDAALQIAEQENESAESKEVLNAMISAFVHCRSIVESVWRGLHPQATIYGLEVR